MKRLVAGLVLLATPVLAQSYSVPPSSGPAANGSPAWHLAPSFPDPTGHTMVDASGKVTVVQRQRGTPDPIRATDDVPGCRGSIVCGRRGGFPRGQLMRVNWDTMPGWTPTTAASWCWNALTAPSPCARRCGRSCRRGKARRRNSRAIVFGNDDPIQGNLSFPRRRESSHFSHFAQEFPGSPPSRG